MAAFAPVEHTEFVVIVQQLYDKSVAPQETLTRILILWGGIAFATIAGGSFVCYSVLHAIGRRWRFI